ncbi:DUF1015 domain-containing protein [Geodermatophilus ruber]|uniref:Uncharacterized conserved protein, DUF1015 family n=1 Tax=Geodermatophilus ruber TaxID=504800 RepID=A0A1I4BEB9_9ACTN|nr:DUF1015 domain-containing protein [Geodermatophilus ruber]SFK67154.1 Uncharacterized conserved protein, DUF1015 family [Geodermatophilus ruber]
MPPPPADAPPPAGPGLEVRPFRALTYRRGDPGHLARVSSPAYDLVTPEGRERLAAADPHNIVRLILPHVLPSDGATASADGPVAQAARTLRDWQAADVLGRDREPAMWLYEMQPPDGSPATLGWLAAVTVPAPGSPAVLPHEDTYPVAVEGRRALLAATGTDLEPIMLAHDPEPTVPGLIAATREGAPTLAMADGEGVRHRLWRVSDPGVLGRLTDAFARTGAVIADGHHRFAAAQAHARLHPGQPGTQAVLALLTPMGPTGLQVHAIHRVVPDLPLEAALSAAARGFEITDLAAPASDPTELLALAHRWLADPGQSGVLVSDGRRLVRLTGPTTTVLDAVPREAPAAWRGLDVVLVHHGLFRTLWGRGDEEGAVQVAHDLEEALTGAVARRGVAVLLRAPAPADVAAVARAGARMPRKSTLFVPKPRTGLVLRPHRD